jgi:guanine nucleotide-binding protein G(i) subunit alpha
MKAPEVAGKSARRSVAASDEGRSSISEMKNAKRASIKIDHQLKLDALSLQKELADTHTVTLLGTGDSGKTTVMRQLSLIHRNGFGAKEMKDYQKAIWKRTK